MNIIYHYFPEFRISIFSCLRKELPSTHFVYGRNGRDNIKVVSDSRDSVKRNIFLGGFIFQTFSYDDILSVYRKPSVILADMRFVNVWLYLIIARLGRQKVYFWTHGVLTKPSGLKWILRRFFLGRADKLLLYSNHSKNILISAGLNIPMEAVGNSNYLHSELDKYESESNAYNDSCCYIGRISKAKGSAEIISLANKTSPNKVVLCGPLDKSCRDEILSNTNIKTYPPCYQLDQLRSLVASTNNFIIFGQSGLAIFTGVLLGKRIIVKRHTVQKPEFWILKEYGLVEEFDSVDELFLLLNERWCKGDMMRAKRRHFLQENSSEAVAKRIVNAITE